MAAQMGINISHFYDPPVLEFCRMRNIRVMTDALRKTRFRGTTTVAMQHGVVGPFLPRAERTQPERQYLLAL